MTEGHDRPLRVALVHHAFGSGAELDRLVRNLAGALHAAGHHPTVVTKHRVGSSGVTEGRVPVVRCRGLPEAPLLRRGFAVPLTHLPTTVAALVKGGYDLAQAFSPTDAAAAIAWREIVGRPVIFAPAEPPRRDRVADRRLRLRLLERAVGDSDAAIAPTEECRAGLLRWLAVEAPLLEPADADAHERLYRELLRPAAARGQS